MSAATGTSRRTGEPRTGSSPRATEARLLAFAVVVTVFASMLLGWSQSPELPPSAVLTGVALTVVAIVAHLVVRATAPGADPTLLPLAFLLNGLGLVFVRRVDLAAGSDLATTQTVWTAVSVAAMCVVLVVVRNVRLLSRYQYTFGLLTLVLLVLPLVPGLSAGVINGAQLWIDVAGMRFQPGELAKLTMVVFLAGYLERKRALLSVSSQRIGPLLVPPPRHLAPVLVATFAALVVMAGLRDLGSALLLFGAFLAVLYVATGRAAYPALGLVAFAIGASIAYQLFAHVRVRVSIWLDPWSQVTDAGYQLAQSLFAIGTGGLTGAGLGGGRPQDVPFSATDAIFVVVGEELGLLGATALLVAFLLLVVRGYKISLTARDEFGTLLALGLTVTIALQTFVIVGGLTRVVPLTGITLPFVSYGGSSLLGNYVLIALLLRISDESRGRPGGRSSGRRRTIGRRRTDAAGAR
ncbi:FtsW/RodA/SpoVE family cell cycle protein [Egicoccus halophilus]|uniref:Cell division protein FtsW n=1 Tax=Egicoccus halophilus TaxID=1670830 RepID=A0A8J3A7L5_9ACTN|nr:FtsW/RodA/SpoVE family cell cycle protein [Egicoccus halophilus]GGI02918.1 cell division protein FtsW [Egicoccus halophilus]